MIAALGNYMGLIKLMYIQKVRSVLFMIEKAHRQACIAKSPTFSSHGNHKQANILARYKPRINTSELIPTLKHTDKFATDALGYFKSIPHIVLYYEDLVRNHTVSTLHLFVGQITLLRLEENTLNSLIGFFRS